MCLAASNLNNLGSWNWDGDVIVFDTKVPSARPVVGRNGTKYEYPIDVREYLVTDKNAVMRCTLGGDIKDYIREVKGDFDLFNARKERAFDVVGAADTAVSSRLAHGAAGRGDFIAPVL